MFYRYSKSTSEVIEVTVGDRTGGVRDAGGCLGGCDTRDVTNLRVYCCMLDEGDYLLAMSDGVHDNLDPEILHVPPSACGIDGDGETNVSFLTQSSPNIGAGGGGGGGNFSMTQSVEVSHSNKQQSDDVTERSWRQWSEIRDSQLKDRLKRQYKQDQLAEIIGLDPASPKEVTENVLRFIREVTREHREAYELGSVLQRDWAKLEETERQRLNEQVHKGIRTAQGKFDHVTCLAVKVGPPSPHQRQQRQIQQQQLQQWHQLQQSQPSIHQAILQQQQQQQQQQHTLSVDEITRPVLSQRRLSSTIAPTNPSFPSTLSVSDNHMVDMRKIRAEDGTTLFKHSN
jgi:hypothetical protein